MSTPSVHAYVISWTGFEERARAIAAALDGHVERLVVVYSNAEEAPASGAGTWIQVPNSEFYGGKFATSLDDFDGDVMLQIQADASCERWDLLVARCRERFAQRDALDVWSPLVDFSPLPVGLTGLEALDDGLHLVAMTDAVVWAMSREICDWLRTLELRGNTYGWGLDAATAARAHSRGREVVVDTTVAVDHPRGTSYRSDVALELMGDFLARALSPGEARTADFIWKVYDLRTAASNTLPAKVVRHGKAAVRRGLAAVGRLGSRIPVRRSVPETVLAPAESKEDA